MSSHYGSESSDDLPDMRSAKQIRCDSYAVRLMQTEETTQDTSNDEAMELVLEHVLEFQKQFKIIYNPNRELLLCPENESGFMKFICTTIRPTQLPYTELYNWDSAA